MKYFLMLMAAVSFAACDRVDHPRNGYDKDSTGVNGRDQVNPTNPLDTEADRVLTERIRAAIVEDKNLSTDAKDIKIITVNGVITLRGSVLNEAEKANIVNKLRSIIGAQRVDNQLESKQ